MLSKLTTGILHAMLTTGGHDKQAPDEQPSKRMQSFQDSANTRDSRILTVFPRNLQLSFSTLNSVVFRNYAEANAGRKFLSLFPGLGYAAGYKILQRIYKYVLRCLAFRVSKLMSVSYQVRWAAIRQRLPEVRTYPLVVMRVSDETDLRPPNLSANYKKTFVNMFGEKNGKAMMHATAGRWV